MATVTNQTMADALRKAGFSESVIPTMIAIALGESGGNSQAVCNNCLGVQEYSVGLWQINLYAHPHVTETCAKDPYCAAKAAYAISSEGTNFNPWTVYKTGKYLEFLDKAKEGIGSAIENVKETVKKLSDGDIEKLVLHLPKEALEKIRDSVPSPFKELLSVALFGVDVSGSILVKIVPTSVLRELLLSLPEDMLRTGLTAAKLIADTVGDVAEGVADTFYDLYGFAMPSQETMRKAGIYGISLIVGLILIAAGSRSLAMRSEAFKQSVKVAGAVATKGKTLAAT